jgi:signal transduction histidine kinase
MVLMGATGQITDGQKQVLDTVKRNVDRLAVLVDDVLRISELDRGARELNIDEFDLDALIERTLNSLLSKHRHATKDLEIVHERADQPVIIRADREKITQVLNNVIDNAMSYTLNGGRVDIEVQPDAENQRMIVIVSDTGVGIPEEFYDAIWTRFARHDDTALSMDVAGTGLGLPIVKELVELHNGEVWFESQLGVGTTFYIALPIRQPEVMPTVSTPVSDDRSN